LRLELSLFLRIPASKKPLASGPARIYKALLLQGQSARTPRKELRADRQCRGALDSGLMALPPTDGTAAYNEWAGEDKGPTIIVLCCVFVAIATIFVIARLYVRLWLFRALRADDYWCIAALVSDEHAHVCQSSTRER
jgi:hypothetical protein